MSSRNNILFLAIMVCVSCGPAKVVSSDVQRDSVIRYVRDSIYVHDTLVMASIPPESGSNVLPDTDTSFLRTSVAESEAYVKDGKLHHTLRNRSDAIIPVRVKVVDRARIDKASHIGWRNTVEVVEVEKQLSKWQNFIMSLGYAVLIAGIAWLIWKLSKIVRL